MRSVFCIHKRNIKYIIKNSRHFMAHALSQINSLGNYLHIVIVDFCGWLGAAGLAVVGGGAEVDEGGGGGLGRSAVAAGGAEWNVACITTAATLGCSLCESSK